jgi:tripartite-type tricarboxylate transporter receptor subunit TctC
MSLNVAPGRRPGDDKQQVQEVNMSGYALRVRVLAASLIVLGLAATGHAETFPSRTIKIVVGFGPGGIGDIVARSVAQKMSDSLGKPVVIENMPGAGGMTAAAAVARAEPDGHTLLLVSGQNTIAPALFKSVPYDPAAFAMVSTLSFFDFLVVVRKDSPLRTLSDLIASAKKDPGHFNIGTISVGSIQNLSALLFASMTDLKVPIVPFRTTGDVIAGLMSDQIQVGFETFPAVIGQVQSGNLRALAIASERRAAFLPEVPTAVESGLPNYKFFSWNGFVVPAKTPRDIVLLLNKEVAKAVQAPDVQARFKQLGIEPHTGTPEDMQRVYDEDGTRWREVIRRANIGQQ